MREAVEPAELAIQRLDERVVFRGRCGLEIERQQRGLWTAGLDDAVIGARELALRATEQGDGRALAGEGDCERPGRCRRLRRSRAIMRPACEPGAGA